MVRWFDDPTADVEVVAPGISFISAPGHGGYCITKERERQMHPALRKRSTKYAPRLYYEEDCEAALVALAFRQLPVFAPLAHISEDTVKRIYPDQYADWKK